jgi:hypothetical protein
MKISVTLFRRLNIFDGTKQFKIVIIHLEPGDYELECIQNPRENGGNNWYVLKGTCHGMAINAWLQHPPNVLALKKNGQIVAQLQ